MFVLLQTPEGTVQAVVVTTKLADALQQFTPSASCPKYVREAWEDAMLNTDPTATYKVSRA